MDTLIESRFKYGKEVDDWEDATNEFATALGGKPALAPRAGKAGADVSGGEDEVDANALFARANSPDRYGTL